MIITSHAMSRRTYFRTVCGGGSGPLSFWKVCDLPLYENQGWNHKTCL